VKKTAKKVSVANVGNYSLIQLGAYTDMDNAIAEQKKVKNAVSALNDQDIFIEQAVVNGTLYHRLQIRPEASQLNDLCNQIISAGFDCILK
jgi:hypothetical protein